jgi:hypothetical protein
VIPLHVAAHVDRCGAGSEQLFAYAAEQPADRVLAAQQQAMRMTTLRNAATRFGRRARLVALDDRDGLEVVGQHSCRQQSCHAPTDDDRVAETLALHVIPALSG